MLISFCRDYRERSEVTVMVFVKPDDTTLGVIDSLVPTLSFQSLYGIGKGSRFGIIFIVVVILLLGLWVWVEFFILVGVAMLVVDLHSGLPVDPCDVEPSLGDEILDSQSLAGPYCEANLEMMEIRLWRMGKVLEGHLRAHIGRVRDVRVQKAAVEVEREAVTEFCTLGEQVAGSIPNRYVAYWLVIRVSPELQKRIESHRRECFATGCPKTGLGPYVRSDLLHKDFHTFIFGTRIAPK